MAMCDRILRIERTLVSHLNEIWPFKSRKMQKFVQNSANSSRTLFFCKVRHKFVLAELLLPNYANYWKSNSSRTFPELQNKVRELRNTTYKAVNI